MIFRKTIFIFIILLINFAFAEIDFYQLESEGYVRNPKFTDNGYIFTDNLSNTLYKKNGNKVSILLSAPGCGRYISLSTDKRLTFLSSFILSKLLERLMI
ncbi:MAG: hypothetical protein K8S23_15585 [Candidatus Cloacimonetes bacterium]|nr:hypothetical protein [Candidatus Cloacimonadota bacterium]